MSSRLTTLVGCLIAFSAGCAATAPVAPKRAAPESLASAPDESWRRTAPKPGPAHPVALPEAQIRTLENGLRVWFLPHDGGLVHVSVVAKGGGRTVPRGKSGVAAVTARLLTEGTKRSSSSELAERVEDLGAELQHEAARDYTRVGTTVAASELADAVTILAEVVRSPRFADEDVARVRREWLEHLRAEQQDPVRRAITYGLGALLGDQGRPVSGLSDEVAALERPDIVQYHRSAFNPSNVAVVVVGDVSGEAASVAVDGAFADWSAPAPTPNHPGGLPAAPERTQLHIIDRPGAVQTVVFAAARAPARGEAGYEARQLANAVLGGSFTSRLNQNLRERNAFTYSARSRAVATVDWGAWILLTSVRTSDTGAALGEVMRELERVRAAAPVRADELERARTAELHELEAAMMSTEGSAAELAELFVHDLPPDYLKRAPKRWQAVPLAAVRAAASAPELSRAMVTLVGDASAIRSDAEKALSTDATVSEAER